MGRRKTYDRDDVAQRAMLVFWRHGYEATTIQDIEEALQINRYSLFAEFGSKRGLFEAALDTYEALVVSANLAVLEAPGASVESVVEFLDRFRIPDDEAAMAGCMLCNAAVEQAPASEVVQRQTQAYFLRLNQAFRHALGPERTTAAAALTSATVGAFVQARSGMSAEARSRAIDGIVAWVRSL